MLCQFSLSLYLVIAWIQQTKGLFIDPMSNNKLMLFTTNYLRFFLYFNFTNFSIIKSDETFAKVIDLLVFAFLINIFSLKHWTLKFMLIWNQNCSGFKCLYVCWRHHISNTFHVAFRFNSLHLTPVKIILRPISWLSEIRRHKDFLFWKFNLYKFQSNSIISSQKNHLTNIR